VVQIVVEATSVTPASHPRPSNNSTTPGALRVEDGVELRVAGLLVRSALAEVTAACELVDSGGAREGAAGVVSAPPPQDVAGMGVTVAVGEALGYTRGLYGAPLGQGDAAGGAALAWQPFEFLKVSWGGGGRFLPKVADGNGSSWGLPVRAL
jgi:hypothetical protein